jgi:hypothetical protein
MIRIPIVFITLAVFVLVSCKSKQQTNTQTQVTTTVVAPPPPPPLPPGQFRMIVSFFSEGAGIDNALKEKFDAMVSSHPKKPVFEEVRWGREGEVDYHFMLTEMNAQEQAEFVKKTKELLATGTRVNMSENAAPIHGKKEVVQDHTGKARLLVSFISIGTGIDLGMKEKFDAMIANHPKKPKVDMAPWGREGEVDYYFNLTEMSPQEQADFVIKTKELLGKNERVHITENEMPRHLKKEEPLPQDIDAKLIVSFISIGQGKDVKAKEKLDEFLKEYPKVKYTEAWWGREGEVDYCFTLTELNKKEQEDFVAKVKQLVGNNQLVQIMENKPCRKGR